MCNRNKLLLFLILALPSTEGPSKAERGQARQEEAEIGQESPQEARRGKERPREAARGRGRQVEGELRFSCAVTIELSIKEAHSKKHLKTITV